MNHNWKDDPRIRAMNPEKIQFLAELTEQLRKTPQKQMMNRFLSLTLEAQKRGISFSGQETDLLTGILIDYMPPADREKLDLFRMLSKKLAGAPQSERR